MKGNMPFINDEGLVEFPQNLPSSNLVNQKTNSMISSSQQSKPYNMLDNEEPLIS